MPVCSLSKPRIQISVLKRTNVQLLSSRYGLRWSQLANNVDGNYNNIAQIVRIHWVTWSSGSWVTIPLYISNSFLCYEQGCCSISAGRIHTSTKLICASNLNITVMWGMGLWQLPFLFLIGFGSRLSSWFIEWMTPQLHDKSQFTLRKFSYFGVINLLHFWGLSRY